MSLSKQEKFERRRQKLLEKNSRLKGKKSKKNDCNPCANNVDAVSSEWNEMIELLSRRDIILRPQILFQYFALLIQSFAGSNIVIALNRNASILNSSSTSNTNNILNIEYIFPILNRNNYHNNKEQKQLLRYAILENNVTGFGILTDRKSMTKNATGSDHINPYFLSNEYEWKCIGNDDGIYLSTIYKDYRLTENTKIIEHIIDNTFRNTSNIQDALIICNQKYGYIPIFCSVKDVFYTDPRIKYHDIKTKWKDNINENEIITKKISNDTSNYYHPYQKQNVYHPKKMRNMSDKLNISLSIMDESLVQETGHYILKLWIQNDDKIYVLTNCGKIYNIIWNNIDNKEYDEDINGLIKKLDDIQPNYMIYTNNSRYNDDDFRIKTLKNDRNVKNRGNIFENKCNKQLKKCKLFDMKQIDIFKTLSLQNEGLINGIYYDYDIDTKRSGLYICHNYLDRMNGYIYSFQHSWDLQFVFNKIDDKLLKEYKYSYQQFMEKNKFLKEEQCYIMFVDERKLQNKQIIIICGKYLVTMNVLNGDESDVENKKDSIIQPQSFGNVYLLNDIIPELSIISTVRGAKWFYSYSKQTLYIFEKMSASSNYPYILRRIALQSFHFE